MATCGSCKYYSFKGFKQWCKEHDKQIKKPDVGCKAWLDMFFKKRLT